MIRRALRRYVGTTYMSVRCAVGYYGSELWRDRMAIGEKGLAHQSFALLKDENEQWFENHKHLTNQEMLDLGLIDECDLRWVNSLRKGKREENGKGSN